MATMISQPAKTRTDDSYFVGMAIVILGIILLGFARTYYFAGTSTRRSRASSFTFTQWCFRPGFCC